MKNCLRFKITQIVNNRSTDNRSQQELLISISAMSFIDDTIWLASSKVELQNILKIAESFFELTGIKVNVEKSDTLIINQELVNSSTFKENSFNDIPIVFHLKQKLIRYLEIFLEPKGCKKYQKQLFNKKVNITCYSLKSVKISDKQLQYIINSVLIFQLFYLTIDFFPSYHIISSVNTKIHKLFKSKYNLKQQIPSAFLHDNCWYNIANLELLIKQQSIKQFYNAINDNSILGWAYQFYLDCKNYKIASG